MKEKYDRPVKSITLSNRITALDCIGNLVFGIYLREQVRLRRESLEEEEQTEYLFKDDSHFSDLF